MSTQSYSESNARHQTELLRDTLKELPSACHEFMRAIEPTTTALTRLAYARDLRLFFRFLSDEHKNFGGFSPDDWTTSISPASSRSISTPSWTTFHYILTKKIRNFQIGRAHV